MRTPSWVIELVMRLMFDGKFDVFSSFNDEKTSKDVTGTQQR